MRVLTAAIVALALTACEETSTPPSAFGEFKEGNVLKVLIRSDVTMPFVASEPSGFERDLIDLFAERLGARVQWVPSESYSAMFRAMKSDEAAHFAAAGVTVTAQRERLVRFGPAYHEITPYVVYRSGGKAPESVEDLVGARLEVVAGSSHAELLKNLRKRVPDLKWSERDGVDVRTLLERVAEGEIDYTVAGEHVVDLARHLHPELRIGFAVSEPQRLAWAFPKRGCEDLYGKAHTFFREIEENGVLKQLLDRHYGHTDDFDYVGVRTFLEHVKERLPRYRPLFDQAARATGADWRLLAAMGYQESHWNPRAVSPTGVKGLMMLTLPTARQMNVDNRLDPQQSIMGGARYVVNLKSRIPERITDPDRTWLALAAYNVGMGHLEDARVLTERHGKNPDRWIDVRQHLPLLTKKKWYRQTRYGYARGHEPVHYVENIRRYYTILQRLFPETLETPPTRTAQRDLP